jgi:glycosyltransferase involved in cell wall biosynthesis
VTIPNGVDLEHLTFHREQATSDQPIVLTVGRLERYKNVDLIIDAFGALPSPATLVVVGDGPERARLEQRAQASGSGWPILFTGRISDPMLKQWFARAHVVTSASDHEAFGLALAEGLASGTRVVASAIPAHVSLGRLAGASTPVSLVDPRDTRRFTDLLAESLMAGRIQERSFTLPSWNQVVGTTRELYSQILLRGITHEGTPDVPQPFIMPYYSETAPTEPA